MTEPRRTSSGTQRLGLADCPKCDGTKTIKVPLGIVPNAIDEKCDYCNGTEKVTLAKAGEFFGLEPATRRDTPRAMHAVHDTEPPDTEPDPETKE